MGLFGVAHGWGAKKAPLHPNICHTYPTIMKLGTVIPYLRKIQKIYESREHLVSFANISTFSQKSAYFAISRITGLNFDT